MSSFLGPMVGQVINPNHDQLTGNSSSETPSKAIMSPELSSHPMSQHIAVIPKLPYTPPQEGAQYLLLSAQPPQMHDVLTSGLFKVIGDAIFINAYPDTTSGTRFDNVQLITAISQAKGYTDITSWLGSHTAEPLDAWISRFV